MEQEQFYIGIFLQKLGKVIGLFVHQIFVAGGLPHCRIQYIPQRNIVFL